MFDCPKMIVIPPKSTISRGNSVNVLLKFSFSLKKILIKKEKNSAKGHALVKIGTRSKLYLLELTKY